MTMPTNTKISFLYRDGANYKTPNEVVIPGEITQDQIARIISSLDDGCYFIPERVGLEAERWCEYNPDLDHLWCELYPVDFENTQRKPTVNVSPEDLTARFVALRCNWEDDSKAFDWEVPGPDIDD